MEANASINFHSEVFLKSELEDLAPGNKTSDLSLIFFILNRHLFKVRMG